MSFDNVYIHITNITIKIMNISITPKTSLFAPLQLTPSPRHGPWKILFLFIFFFFCLFYNVLYGIIMGSLLWDEHFKKCIPAALWRINWRKSREEAVRTIIKLLS